MKDVSLVGIDLAKRVFHLCAMNSAGDIVWEGRAGRSGLMKKLEKLPSCRVAMEACGGAHDWGRRIGALGHDVVLIHTRRVAAFVGAHKNDRVDARAICEAARQAGTRWIAVKSLDQQALQSLIRLRAGLVRARTAEINRVRAILHEFGIVIPRGRLAAMRRLGELTDTPLWREAMPPELGDALLEQIGYLKQLDTRIDALSDRIAKGVAEHRQGALLMSIQGFGPLNTASLLAAVADEATFRNGRQFAAWIGLVPRQDTTGGRVRLRGITKAGNTMLRRDLVHGARAVVSAACRRGKPNSTLDRWILERKEHMPMNRLVVAVANKLARIAWAVMTTGKPYTPYPG